MTDLDLLRALHTQLIAFGVYDWLLDQFEQHAGSVDCDLALVNWLALADEVAERVKPVNEPGLYEEMLI